MSETFYPFRRAFGLFTEKCHKDAVQSTTKKSSIVDEAEKNGKYFDKNHHRYLNGNKYPESRSDSGSF
jgi:hypothetical protein